jgi:hypothetical protein
VTTPPYTLEFYEDEHGHEPVLDWLRGLTPSKRRAIGVAMFEILQPKARLFRLSPERPRRAAHDHCPNQGACAGMVTVPSGVGNATGADSYVAFAWFSTKT